MLPFFLTFGKFHKVGDRLRRIFFKEAANDGSFAGFKRGVRSRLSSHKIIPFEMCFFFLDYSKAPRPRSNVSSEWRESLLLAPRVSWLLFRQPVSPLFRFLARC